MIKANMLIKVLLKMMFAQYNPVQSLFLNYQKQIRSMLMYICMSYKGIYET